MNCPTHDKIKVKPGVWYLFDISPSMQYQHMDIDPVKRYKKFRSMMYEYFLPFKPHGIDYDAHIEIGDWLGEYADYNNYPKLHVHCNIKMTTKGVFHLLMNHLPRALQYGRVKLDTIEDMNIRQSYINKQAWLFEELGLDPELGNTFKKNDFTEILGDSGDQESPALSDSESLPVQGKGPKDRITIKVSRKRK